MIVVTDASPIRYLISLDADWLLPKLYSRILCPNVVIQECAQNSAPNKVRLWATQPPEWLEIRHISELNHSSLGGLDPGERSALVLLLKSVLMRC
jgi:predicted nucleic acid-binding protein